MSFKLFFFRLHRSLIQSSVIILLKLCQPLNKWTNIQEPSWIVWLSNIYNCIRFIWIATTYQSWVSGNIYNLRVNVLCDRLVRLSCWSVPMKSSSSFTLRKNSRVFYIDVPKWFFWNSNVFCIFFYFFISNSWSGFVICFVDFYRTYRVRMAKVIGSACP